MSTTLLVKLVVGFRFSRNDLVRTVVAAGCKHPYPESARFCPTCGKSTAAPKEIDLIDFWDDKDGELDIAHGNYDGGDWVADYYVIGNKLTGTCTPLNNIGGGFTKQQLIEMLTDKGIDTTVGEYGMHVVTYYS